MKAIFKGCATALATPFKDNKFDANAYAKLIEYQLENGVSALVACGTTGEPSTLSSTEWAKVIEACIKQVNGRVPVIAGTGSNNTTQVIEKAQEAKRLGADAQLIVTPYYNKTTQEGLIAHFSIIAEKTELPIIVYNVPSRTGMTISADTVGKLSKIDNIVAIKEATSDMALEADMMVACDNKLHFYSGSDETVVPFMSIGGLGVISVVSNVAPKITSDMTGAMLNGDYKYAASLQLKLMRLIRLLFSKVSPIPLKAALSLIGICENEVRLPLIPMTESEMQPLKQCLKELNLI